MRVVVVTGAARGIGARIAEEFRDRGDSVIGLDISPPPNPLDNVSYIDIDLTESAVVADVFSSLGPVDVLVNNAGIQRVGLVGRQPVDEYLQVISANLNSAYFTSREVLATMPDGGSIIFISSVVASLALPGRAAYSAAKAGLLGLTRVMAVELAPRRIRVNAICPGFIHTALTQQGIDDGSVNIDWLVERVPLGRLGEIEEIARVAVFLAGDSASYITGQALIVDGGWSVQGISHAPDWLSWESPTTGPSDGR
jgi:NAD(P)-dependent dehydrogenase (short-subunit alcohol dehydrogenase family)